MLRGERELKTFQELSHQDKQQLLLCFQEMYKSLIQNSINLFFDWHKMLLGPAGEGEDLQNLFKASSILVSSSRLVSFSTN